MKIYKRNVAPTSGILDTNILSSFFLNLKFIERLTDRKYIVFFLSILKSLRQKLGISLKDCSTNCSLTNLISKFQKSSLIYVDVNLKYYLEKLNIVDIKIFMTCFAIFFFLFVFFRE